MTEANKNTLKDLAKIFGGMGILVTLMLTIPNGSFAQKVLGFLMLSALVASIVWFTPLGNPIKRFLRNRQKK